ncbi:MAG TPA: iron uptake porin, partial [Chroococcales cyanobacterium]
MKKKIWIAATLTLVACGLFSEKTFAFTPTSELTDVSPDHWAYHSIKSLVDKYQVMEGFNDNTFRGAKYVTRYELAAVLSKVMNKVEELITSATGTAPTPIIPPSINPEDLRSIARLQQEFRDELSILKGKTDTMDTRLAVLESRVRVHGALEWNTRSFTNKGNERGHTNNRVITDLALDARISPELSYSGDLEIFNNGVQSFTNGHLWAESENRGIANTVGDSGMPLYVRRSYLSWAPGNWTLSGGVMSFGDTLPIGSAIKNGFDSLPLWSEGQSGYGFVG